MIRSFLALPVPQDTAEALMDLQTGVRNARWIADDMMHITIAFLGACTSGELSELDGGLASLRLEKLSLKPEGTGSFGGGRPRQLYAAIAQNDALQRLHAKVLRTARDAGIAVERRKFIPHITLARCGGGVIPSQAIEWTVRNARWSHDPFDVHHITLFRSDLNQRSAVYTEMTRYELV